MDNADIKYFETYEIRRIEMDYPNKCNLKVEKVFGEQQVEITLYSGLTTFIGANASGKTQTLKELRNYLKKNMGSNKVRYLSSNRIGTMEQFRSKINQYSYSVDQYNVGDQGARQARHEIETVNGDFFTMDDRKDVYIKVAERLSVLFNRQIYIRWDAGNMKVFFGKTEIEDEYSVVAEASGLVNIISILAALFDEDVQVLMIDEPEVSLHPQLQSYLLREIQKAVSSYEKVIIISTHSTEMISCNSIKDLSNLVFFSEKIVPIQIAPGMPELENRKLKDFFMRMSQVYKTGFFAKKVLLIEGASDLIICRFLSNKLDLNIDVAGSQIIPVDGKGQFPVVTKLFRLIGKEVAVLTDLDGFTDDNSIVDLFSQLPDAIKLANECGNDNISEMIRSIKSKISELVQSHKDDMKAVYETHPYWINKDDKDDEDKVIRRALVAQLFSFDNNVLQNWSDATAWMSLKTRLNSLFSILETVGCFVLKKGAIESYYLYAPNTAYSEKPSAAADEIGELQTKDNELICSKYEDVIHSLKYAALTKNVDESFAVKKELLSELALVLGVLPTVSNENEIYSIIKQAKGSSNSLFNYKIINNNDKLGVEVSLHSAIIDVSGLPFQIFTGQNVNEVVNGNVKQKNV